MMNNQSDPANTLNNIPMSNSMKNQINNPKVSRKLNQLAGIGMHLFTKKIEFQLIGLNLWIFSWQNEISLNEYES